VEFLVSGDDVHIPRNLPVPCSGRLLRSIALTRLPVKIYERAAKD